MPVKDTKLYYHQNKEAFARASKKSYELRKGTFACAWCKKCYSSKQSMKRHMAKSCPDKPL
jgi:hypothetical protein